MRETIHCFQMTIKPRKETTANNAGNGGRKKYSFDSNLAFFGNKTMRQNQTKLYYYYT